MRASSTRIIITDARTDGRVDGRMGCCQWKEREVSSPNQTRRRTRPSEYLAASDAAAAAADVQVRAVQGSLMFRPDRVTDRFQCASLPSISRKRDSDAPRKIATATVTADGCLRRWVFEEIQPEPRALRSDADSKTRTLGHSDTRTLAFGVFARRRT